MLAPSQPPPDALQAFRDDLRQRGYIEGQNCRIEVRWPEGGARIADVAGEMVRSGVDVIVAWATPPSLAAKQATSTVPIVMVSIVDPIKLGLVTNFSRPEGNVTGLSNLGEDISAKMVQLLVETLPNARQIGMLHNPDNPATLVQMQSMQAAVRAFRLTTHVDKAKSASEYAEALTKFAQAHLDAVIFVPDPSALEHRMSIAEKSRALRLPTMFQRRENVEAGGLMSYGADLADQFRQAGAFVDRLLKGAKPSDLPVMQATRFNLVINGRTARMLGVDIPAKVAAAADEIID